MRNFGGQLICLWAGVALVAGCSNQEGTATLAVADSGVSAAKSLAAIIASCASATGEVQVRRAGMPYWEPVKTGTVFRAGDWVRTSKQAAARVEFLVGGGLELGAEAVVVIDKAPPRAGKPEGAAPEALVAVESGEVKGFAAAVPKDGPAPALHIRAADGSQMELTAKEGEEPMQFRLTRGARATEVAVTHGAATIKGGDETQSELHAGQATDVTAGKASPVVELPDFPQLTEPGIDARFKAKPDQTIRLVWKKVAAAASYRLEVARDFSFQVLAVVADTRDTGYTFTPEREAVYVWRVASRDAAGRQGEFGFARRIYIEHDQPKDLLIGPADGALFAYLDVKPKVAFSWQSAADAQAYRLVIAASPDLLRSPVVTLKVRDQRAEVKTLNPGEYYWGAYSDGNVPEPIFLKPRKLTVKKTGKDKLKTPKAINQWGE